MAADLRPVPGEEVGGGAGGREQDSREVQGTIFSCFTLKVCSCSIFKNVSCFIF